MASHPNLSVIGSNPTPLLSEIYSGIPMRLEQDAKVGKDRIYSNTTVPDSVPRQGEVPRLPPNTSREKFNRAMTELKERIGTANIKINDKPLVDGWYMEHPYVSQFPLSRSGDYIGGSPIRHSHKVGTHMMHSISHSKRRWFAVP